MSSGFISEADIAEKRRIQNELWQVKRKEGDPENPPEEEPNYDRRSLYERLEEQKAKKQEDWEEAHKLKNMVRGLEDDEVDFLELVDNTKIEEEKRIRKEENSALREFRKKVAEQQQKALKTNMMSELKTEKKSVPSTSKKISQVSLLAGAIKRKDSQSDEASSKKAKRDSSTTDTKSPTSPSESNNEPEIQNKTQECSSDAQQGKKIDGKGILQCVAILPGLGNYTDSSDSDASDSDSDVAPTPIHRHLHRDLTGRIVKLSSEHQGGCC